MKMSFKEFWEAFVKGDDVQSYAAQTLGGTANQYRKLGSGGEKTSVLTPQGQVARFYHDMDAQDYKHSEGRISDVINNPLIMPRVTFTGHGYDLAEKVLPMEDIMRQHAYVPLFDEMGQPKYSRKSGKQMTQYRSALQYPEPDLTAFKELIKSYNSNPLLKNNLIEASPIESSGMGKNVGLGIRQGRVYVLPYDVASLFEMINSKGLKRLVAMSRPYGVPLQVFRGTIWEPHLRQLTTS